VKDDETRARLKLAALLLALVALGVGMVVLALAITGMGVGTSRQDSPGALPLLTQASRAGGPMGPACYLSFATGRLVLDVRYGAAIVENGAPMPVMWPIDYRARASGGELEVVDASGASIVTTGSTVRIWGGYEGDSPRYFLACGDPLPVTNPGQ
jgi:hypothetical protein